MDETTTPSPDGPRSAATGLNESAGWQAPAAPAASGGAVLQLVVFELSEGPLDSPPP